MNIIRVGLSVLFIVGLSAGVYASPAAPVVTFKGLCDASAAQLIGNNRFIVANDEDNVLRIYDVNRPDSFPVGEMDVSSHLGIGHDDETDLEATAMLNGKNYWLTSHGRNKNGKLKKARYWFFATSVQGGSDEGGIAFSGSPYHKIVEDMLKDNHLQMIHNVLKKATRLNEDEVEELAPKKKGLNIEAMAPHLEGGGLYIGLRNPTFERKAILVLLTNPEQVIHSGAKAEFAAPVLLDLHGLAFRSMEAIHVGEQSFYLIVAGPKESGEGMKLARWSGNPEDQVTFIQDLPLSPEAISYDAVKNELIITSDDGTRDIGGRPCKELDAATRMFRVMILDRNSAHLP